MPSGATLDSLLKGRTAVITGASSGIGRAIAERFAAEGATVFLGSRHEEDVARVAEAIRKAGGTAHAHALDVTRPESVRAFAEAARGALAGRVDILVNNAGVGRYGLAKDMPMEDFDEQIDTNLRGPILVTKAFLPLLLAGKGRPRAILNVASVSGLEGMAGLAGYCASKFGLRGFSLALAAELAEEGIRVTAVNPGYVNTPMVAGASTPGEAMIQPDEIAETCLRIVTLPGGVMMDEATLWPSRLYSEG